ncbi:MAG: hypothetical protein IKU10_01095 [Clostridia bacterium]|nr:hypothetical protein [Clostridia bacterium]
MTNVNQLMQTLTTGGVGNPMSLLAQKLKGVFPMEKGETVRNRQVLRVEKGDQKIFFYATTLRKRKK